MPVTIDPRRHDAVLFDTALDRTQALTRRLREAGVDTGVFASNGNVRDTLSEAADKLSVRPGRCAVLTDNAACVQAARDGGFALVIGLDRTGQSDALRRVGADAVVGDLDEVAVRTGDHRMSQLPDAVQALGALTDRRPAICSSTSTARCRTSS
ncbi:hypothetical protein MAV100_26570, partial [Mycobacterium avium subsp. hominissuis 100]